MPSHFPAHEKAQGYRAVQTETLQIKLNGARADQLWTNLLALVVYACECKQKQGDHWPYMVSTDAGTIRVKQIDAAEPVLRYATRLAETMWEKYWKKDSPDWKPFPDLLGVLTQIDNMVAGMTRKEKLDQPVGLIPINPAQGLLITQWAADDRLWTTQETVALNLETFARAILKEQ